MAGDRSSIGSDTAGDAARAVDLALRALIVVALIGVTTIVLLAPRNDEPGARIAVSTEPPSARPSDLYAAPYPSAGGARSTLVSPSPASSARAPSEVTVSVTASTVRAWQSQDVAETQIVAVVHNSSSTPVEFVPSASRYRVFDRSGREVTHGRFTYAAPDRVAPGADAYLIETIPVLFATAKDIERVQVDPVVRPTDTPARLLPTADIEWHASANGGLEASGRVTNDTDATLDAVFVCVVFFDRSDHVVAGVYDLTDVRDLAPGATQRFDTPYPGTPPIARQDVGRVEAVALELELPGG